MLLAAPWTVRGADTTGGGARGGPFVRYPALQGQDYHGKRLPHGLGRAPERKDTTDRGPTVWLDPAIKLDCGSHPAFKGLAAMPYFDVVDMEKVDLILISQYVHECRCRHRHD